MPRKPRPRQSRLSMQTQVNQLKQENEELRDALELIADILEDVGILDPPDEGLSEHKICNECGERATAFDVATETYYCVDHLPRSTASEEQTPEEPQPPEPRQS